MKMEEVTERMRHKRQLPADPLARALASLERAIARHGRHMDGTEPTTGPAGEKSQQKMMDEMREALSAIKRASGQT